MPEKVLLPGPVGNIEAVIARPVADSATSSAVAVVCHPHPLYGGSMDNKVVTTLVRCCTEAGMAALRFNFRGIGASEGHFDHGEGEVVDVLAALEWAGQATGARQHVMLGFSFGGMVAVQAALRCKPAQLVTVSPALYALGETALRAPGCPWLLIHGRDDDVVDCDDTVSRVEGLQPPVDIHVLDGVGHFYHGRLGSLREIVIPALKRSLAELPAS